MYQYVREWLISPSFVLYGININQSCNSQVLGDSIDCYRFYNYYTLSDQIYASAFSSVIEMTLLETGQQLIYKLYTCSVCASNLLLLPFIQGNNSGLVCRKYRLQRLISTTHNRVSN